MLLLKLLTMFIGATVTSSGAFSVTDAEVASISSAMSTLGGSFFTTFIKFLGPIIIFGVTIWAITWLTGMFRPKS